MKNNLMLLALLLILLTRFYQSRNPVLAVRYAGIAPQRLKTLVDDTTGLPSIKGKALKTRYLFVVTTDGLRWQEVFAGADSALLYNPKFTPPAAPGIARFQSDSASTRRHLLMPFFWSMLAKKGQLYGNRLLHNEVDVLNRMWFSYPGYNEMFSGKPDDGRIFMNAKIFNPNETVLECLARCTPFRGKVSAFGTWDAFDFILRETEKGLSVASGNENRTVFTEKKAVESYPGGAVPPDFYTWTNAFHQIQTTHPAVVFMGFDDTDARAHAGEYDRYLEAAHRFDNWMATLWQYIQQDSVYRNQTTLLITTDHGRGTGRKWRDHNRLVQGSDAIWLAAIGPDTPALGEVSGGKRVYQAQVAQTIAGLLGYDYTAEHEAAPAIETIFSAGEPAELLVQDASQHRSQTVGTQVIPILSNKK